MIARIKELKDEQGSTNRILKVIQRTDYSGESDEISCMAAAEMCKATRMKIIKDSESILITSIDYAPLVLGKIEEQLKPNSETDIFNWNQIRRAINDSKFDIL
jgi:hypothetical protein